VSGYSEFRSWGNGPNDEEGYSRSLIQGRLTMQQFAAWIGKNQGTARGIASGRNGPALGKLFGKQWLITRTAAIQYAEEHGLLQTLPEDDDD